MLRRLLVVIPVVAIAVTGCASGTPPGLAPSTSEGAPAVTPSTPPSGPSTGHLPPGAADSPGIQAAVADLAGKLGVSPDDIEVSSVEEVTWSDGSLGCPQPGVRYTQALVNGQLVVLTVGGRAYQYHSGPRRPLFYCANPRPPVRDGSGAGA